MALRAVLLLALGGFAVAQNPPAAQRWTTDPPADSPGGRLLQRARELRAKNDSKLARETLLAVLPEHPGSGAVLRELVLASDDPAERARWTQALIDATGDERGHCKLERTLQPQLANADAALQRAAARAAAVTELVRFVDGLKPTGSGTLGNAATVRWAAGLAQELMRESPALWQQHEAALAAALARHKPDHAAVFSALRALLERSYQGGTTAAGEGGADPAAPLDAKALDALDLALRAARCLTGLAAQAGFKDLEGPPPPDMKDLAKAAREARGRVRGKLEAGGAPLRVEELEAMSTAERAAFTVAHARWTDPGVAVSPGGRYRIETTCGFETLLGAARTIEQHHQRIANWHGKDPFTSQQGLVRIVPSHADLEAEDAPFWWAGGFQSGHVTHLVHSWSTVTGLGRGLTHELTHRFDGTLLPFLPAWLLEGRAVWTGDSYGKVADERFTPRKLEKFTLQAAFVKGYGNPANLTKLIEGEIDDYRDNYTAGYSLFVYLSSWRKGGDELFAKALGPYLRHAKEGRSQPLAHFVRHFCDGKDGRPAKLEEFAAGFQEFLLGGYRLCWQEPVAWQGEFVLDLEREQDGLTMDDPTFSRARARAEPFFGEQHSRDAGRMLARIGQTLPAIQSLLWSAAVDAWSRDDAVLLADLLAKSGRKDPAWATLAEDARRAGVPAPGPPPFAASLPATRTLAELHPRAARALGRDSAAPWPEHHPQALATLGLVEDGLTGYEEKRARGCWFEDGADLHVGRERPREATGLTDRTAHQRHAFVRSREFFRAGQYVLRARIHFTTSFVSGCVVFGGTRRDRNLRLHFSAGDFLYSIGRKDGVGLTEKMNLSLEGLWACEQQMVGTRPSREHKFKSPANSFELELRVDGPFAEVRIDGQKLFGYATTDGSPIEGWIGVAMGQGAVRVQDPTVERCDGEPLAPGADLAVKATVEPPALVHRTLRGVPLAAAGTIVVLVPGDPDFALPRTRAALRGMRAALGNALDFPQSFVVAVPSSLPAELATQIVGEARGEAADRVQSAPHAWTVDGNDVWVLFVDGGGILRAAQKQVSTQRLGGLVENWARRYRTLAPH